MMQDVFSGIQYEHIIAAISKIDKEGIRKGRHSSTYDLLYNGKRYPPKYVLSLAALYARGEELAPGDFEGGENTLAFQFYRRLNFEIVPKQKASPSFWWVNHKQTGKVEVDEGYIWSPKKNKNGSTNVSYDNLTKVKLRDTIFSYAGGKIPAVGKIIANCEMAERPAEFGKTGHQWNNEGWLVRVQWEKLAIPFVPKDHLKEISPLRPEKHSPFQENGNGNQGIYLAEISEKLGNLLLSLIEMTNSGTSDAIEDIETILEEQEEERKIEAAPIKETEKEQIRLARVGQGKFKDRVGRIETKCRITGITEKSLLIASHIKPWRYSSNEERLDGYNGFLLSPHVDKLFDKGYISFTDEGTLLMTKEILPILKNWFIEPHIYVGAFTKQQKVYLDYHRKHIFKG